MIRHESRLLRFDIVHLVFFLAAISMGIAYLVESHQATGMQKKIERLAKRAADETYDETKDRPVKGNRTPIECRVNFDFDSDFAVDWWTSDPALMNELVIGPLEHAEVNTDPGEYEVLGSLTIKYQDGSEEGFFVFHPWGQIKRGDTYLVADLSELRARVQEGCETAVEWAE